jgi:hypothetical protein
MSVPTSLGTAQVGTFFTMWLILNVPVFKYRKLDLMFHLILELLYSRLKINHVTALMSVHLFSTCSARMQTLILKGQ